MGTINRVFLLGNLGRDPEIRLTAAGSKVANLSIATSRRWKDRSSGELEQATDWHRIVVWGDKLIENVVEKYLKKGSPVHIEGELRTRSYEKDGSTRYITEVLARRLQLVEMGGAGPDADHGARRWRVQHQRQRRHARDRRDPAHGEAMPRKGPETRLEP